MERQIKKLDELMDGGAWKLEAVAKIADYLRSNLMGCNVVVIG